MEMELLEEIYKDGESKFGVFKMCFPELLVLLIVAFLNGRRMLPKSSIRTPSLTNYCVILNKCPQPGNTNSNGRNHLPNQRLSLIEDVKLPCHFPLKKNSCYFPLVRLFYFLQKHI